MCALSERFRECKNRREHIQSRQDHIAHAHHTFVIEKP